MRLIHVSDVRLGLSPESEKNFGRQREQEFRESFEQVVSRAMEEGCDLLLVSGGLFSHQPVSAELQEVNRLLSSIPGTQVVILAGKSDVLKKSAPVRSFQWAPNVRYVTEEGLSRFFFPRLNTAVYAASCTDAGCMTAQEAEKTFRERYAAEETAAIRILLLPSLEMDPKDLSESESAGRKADSCGTAPLSSFSYSAFGGISRRELPSLRAYCSGALEPASMKEPGPHGIYEADVSAATGRLIEVSFREMAKASYIPLLVQVTEETGGEELLQLLRAEMERRGEKNVYRIRLLGPRAAETVFLLEPLKKRFRIEDIVDETEPRYDLSALFAEHPQDMIGFYISWLEKNNGESSELDKKAMQYGIRALLETASNGKKAAQNG